MSDPTDETQRRLEIWAADRIKPWGDPKEADYDFRSWAKGASKNRLQAGAVYEYARESRKLRCLLALMNPKRPREQWERKLPALIDGKKPTPNEIASFPAEVYCEPYSFEDLSEHQAERTLGGFLYCLRDLADSLADNVSFAELFRTKRDELEKAFGGLNNLERVQREFRHIMPVDAVELATQSEAERVTADETICDDQKRMIRGETCSEVMAIQIRWRFTDSEIVTAMKRFLRVYRPRSAEYQARQQKEGSRRESVQSALDCLSAMRLASYLPKTEPAPTPGQLAAWKSGASPELKEAAIDIFDAVRLGGRGQYIAESNFDNLITEARKAFKKSFPFGEDPENSKGLKDRVMTNSKRISSQDKV